MNAALIKLYQDVRGSYWFVPAVMALAALMLASGAGFIDSVLTGGWLYSLPLVSSAHPDDLRAVLGAIAGSMITVAGVTFSMTVAAVSYASAQFGPRLIGNFMRDRGNQITLGTFIATFVYCIAILGTVESGLNGNVSGGEPALPKVSFLIALLLALGSVSVLIYFIHHIPETINIGNITSDIGRELLDGIDSLFPEELGEDPPDNAVADRSAMSGPPAEIPATRTGYIQAIDEAALIRTAREADILLRVECRPGHFVTREKIVLHVWPAARVDDEIRARLQRAFAIGRARTATQDTLFLADQLVEIMSRALSPGVCDPFTAINCVDWLEAALSECACRPPPAAERFDGDGTLRVIASPVTFEIVVEAIADRSLQYVASDRNAAIRMMRAFGEIAATADRAACRDIIARRAEQLAAAATEKFGAEILREHIDEEYDLTRTLAQDGPAAGRRRDARGRIVAGGEDTAAKNGEGDA